MFIKSILTISIIRFIISFSFLKTPQHASSAYYRIFSQDYLLIADIKYFVFGFDGLIPIVIEHLPFLLYLSHSLLYLQGVQAFFLSVQWLIEFDVLLNNAILRFFTFHYSLFKIISLVLELEINKLFLRFYCVLEAGLSLQHLIILLLVLVEDWVAPLVPLSQFFSMLWPDLLQLLFVYSGQLRTVLSTVFFDTFALLNDFGVFFQFLISFLQLLFCLALFELGSHFHDLIEILVATAFDTL